MTERRLSDREAYQLSTAVVQAGANGEPLPPLPPHIPPDDRAILQLYAMGQYRAGLIDRIPQHLKGRK